MKYPNLVAGFITGPVRVENIEGGRTIVTHLQKYSHFWSLLTWPFCFHFGLMWKLQKKDP